MDWCRRTRSGFDLAIQLQDEVGLTLVLAGPRLPLGALAVVPVGPGGGLALGVRLRAQGVGTRQEGVNGLGAPDCSLAERAVPEVAPDPRHDILVSPEFGPLLL